MSSRKVLNNRYNYKMIYMIWKQCYFDNIRIVFTVKSNMKDVNIFDEHGKSFRQ